MTTFQFETRLENGTIKIPQEYQQQLKQTNLIKVTLEQENSETKQNFLQFLLENPLKIEELKPMKRTEIYEENE